MSYTNTYKLSVVPGGVPLIIHVSQYDAGLREYTFEPYTADGEFEYVSGATVTLEATKPDGFAVIHQCEYASDGIITYTLQDQLAAKAGKVWSKIVIRDGEDVLGTGTIIWDVDAAGVKDDAIASSSDIGEIRQLMGTPIAVTDSENMTDHSKLYLYEGNESGYTAGNWYYWDGEWTSGGAYASTTYTDDGQGNITIS